MPDALQLLFDTADEIGPFSAQEFTDALQSAECKYKAIMAQRGSSFELWYLTKLVGEQIKQNRITGGCLMNYQKEKSRTVGERV